MKVGFIDHHLNNYHANKFLGIFREGKAGADIEIVCAYESNPEGDEDWCEKNGVAKAGSAAEVVEKSDAILVLAPDNIDAHIELTKEALQSKKPVFIDKVLAETIEDARTIISSAKASDTPIMCASSLRFSVELEQLISLVGEGPHDQIFSRGLGKWRQYAVHTIQPALRLLGGRVKRVIDTGKDSSHVITIENDQGRRAHIDLRFSDNQMETTPWQVGLLHHNNYELITIKQFDEFYVNLAKQMVKFFQTRESSVPVEEMLDQVIVEVSADSSFKNGGQWVDVHA
jgi:predicted dehydrogenase